MYLISNVENYDTYRATFQEEREARQHAERITRDYGSCNLLMWDATAAKPHWVPVASYTMVTIGDRREIAIGTVQEV